MGYQPIVFSNHNLKLPEFNWRVSVSVDMFNFEDTTPYKVFWQMEPPTVAGMENVRTKLLKNWEFYDLILAWDAEVLSSCRNAKFFPLGGVWYQEPDTSEKKFAVSFLTSSKAGCYEYNLRHAIFDALPASIGSLPITKHKSPPYLPNKRSMLVPFQYSIIMENFQNPNYYTEKINDCFATKTIPVYYGAPNIGEFYNTEGMFRFGDPEQKPGKDIQSLFKILEQLTPEYYQSKHDVIEENYIKSLKYCDRTGDVIRAITESWTPKIDRIHSGEPNVG